MNHKLLCTAICAVLTGCTSERIIYRPVTVPPGLTQAVQKPLKPNAKTATQKDVAVFLLEQNAAIDYCNARLKIISNWSNNMDVIDKAKDVEQRQRQTAISAVTTKIKQPGTTDCIGCGIPIPAARRQAYPAATRCIGCQAEIEARQ